VGPSQPLIPGAKGKAEGNIHPITGHKAQRWSRGIALLFLYLGCRWGGWSTPRQSRFTPGKDPIPIVEEVGWAPGTI